jgi:hypothetical protein
MPLPDSESALKSFQAALDTGEICVAAGELEPSIRLHADRPGGEIRLTFVRLEGRRVTSMVQIMPGRPYEDEPCFDVSWAVPHDLRGRGLAGTTLVAAVKELRHRVLHHGMTAFWIEAVVDVDNVASQRVAEKIVSTAGGRDNDDEAGVPILQYFRRVDAQTLL